MTSPRNKWILAALLVGICTQLWFAYGRDYLHARQMHQAYIADLVAQDAQRRAESMRHVAAVQSMLVAGQVPDTAPSSRQRIDQVAIGGYDDPISITCTTAQGVQVPCPDTVYRDNALRMPLWAALERNDVTTLEQLYARWCSGNARFADGMWFLSRLDDAYKYALGDDRWPEQLAKLQAWTKSLPGSEAAHYAEAIYWYHYAWHARGNGYASSVAEEGWRLFREREALALAALDQIGERNFRCPAAYALKIGLLTDQSAPDSQIDAVFRRAVARFPGYHPIYFARARSLSPRWGGDAGQYEAFADEAVALTRNLEGSGMYARLYWLEDDREHGLPFRNVPGVPPTWDKLRAAFEDLMTRYPGSIRNLGKYLDVACRADDHELYRRLRSRLVGYEQYIRSQDPLDVCDLRHGWKEGG